MKLLLCIKQYARTRREVVNMGHGNEREEVCSAGCKDICDCDSDYENWKKGGVAEGTREMQ